LFSCHFGHAAAPIDALRRAERSENSSTLGGENRLILEGASERSGRSALRAANQANTSQDEIRHYVQLYLIRGRFLSSYVNRIDGVQDCTDNRRFNL